MSLYILYAKGRLRCREFQSSFAVVLLLASSLAINLATSVNARAIPNPTPPAVWTRPQLQIARVVQAPKVDGILNDPCWAQATHVSGFYRQEGGAPIVEQTETWICTDKTHLYIAFHCIDSHPELIRQNETQREGSVFDDDYVEVGIDSQGARRNFSYFAVNPRGTQREYLDGGTADNITWAGDWKGASQHTSDGWTAEISIPFALLRYPRNATTFGLLFFRRLARESTKEIWPYSPPAAQENNALYMADLTGMKLPYYTPRPIFLPYVLGTGGQSTSERAGMDIKYPVSTTMTAVATILPDFQTVEQDVVSIGFSYDEKRIRDQRPFFAEGSEYFPARDLYYSPRIGQMDAGLKVVGKQGNTDIGFLSADSWGSDSQTANILALRENFGDLSRVELDYDSNVEKGVPSNTAGKLEGQYGWKVGQDEMKVILNRAPSWSAGKEQDSKDYAGFSITAPDGKPTLYLNYDNIGPSFNSSLGYVPEQNIRGFNGGMEQTNKFDKGHIALYDVGFDAASEQYYSGGFFRDFVSPYAFITNHSGYAIYLNPNWATRPGLHDATYYQELDWGNNTLYQRGYSGYGFGRLDGQSYQFTSITEGIFGTRAFSMNLSYNNQELGGTTTQSILTGTYRLTPERNISCRIVEQTGGGLNGMNVYIAFAQQARSGADVFLLLGDPNSLKSRGIITLKIVRPF